MAVGICYLLSSNDFELSWKFGLSVLSIVVSGNVVFAAYCNLRFHVVFQVPVPTKRNIIAGTQAIQ